MEKLPFNLKSALAGGKVVTRKGWHVTGVKVNPDTEDGVYRITSIVWYPGGNTCTETFTEDGLFSIGKESNCDLFMKNVTINHIK